MRSDTATSHSFGIGMFDQKPELTVKNFDQTKQKSHDTWLRYKNLRINVECLNKGIIAITECDPFEEEEQNSEDTLNLNDHVHNSKFSLKERKLSFRYLGKSTANIHAMPITNTIKQGFNFLQKISNFTNISSLKNCFVIINENRREEFFIPIALDNDMAFYLYAWPSKNNATASEFTGCEQFVTAGCLFAANLKGRDQKGCAFPVIKHNIDFFNHQKIVKIECTSNKPNPYEEILFAEFEKTCCIVDKYSDPKKSKQLLYHLPSYDYVLFGVELFMRGRITLKALDTLIKYIFQKRDEHVKKIQDVCKPHKIEVTILSPFESIFGSRIKGINAKEILSKLGISPEEINPESISTDMNKILEKKLVQDCLAQLENKDINPACWETWKHALDIFGREKIISLEDIFKIANTMVIYIASEGKENNKTCSILPLTEKQIQVNYSWFVKHDKKNQLPSIINFTIFDPVLTYSLTTKGPLFYFDSNENSLSSLINETEIVAYARKKIISHLNNEFPVAINLADFAPCSESTETTYTF